MARSGQNKKQPQSSKILCYLSFLTSQQLAEVSVLFFCHLSLRITFLRRYSNFQKTKSAFLFKKIEFEIFRKLKGFYVISLSAFLEIEVYRYGTNSGTKYRV